MGENPTLLAIRPSRTAGRGKQASFSLLRVAFPVWMHPGRLEEQLPGRGSGAELELHREVLHSL